MIQVLRGLRLFSIFPLLLCWPIAALRAQEAVRDATRDPSLSSVALRTLGQEAFDGGLRGRLKYVRQGSRYLRVSLNDVHLKEGMKLRITDQDGGVLLDVHGPLQLPSSHVFVPGPSFVLETTSPTGGPIAGAISEVWYHDPNLAPWLSIFGDNDMAEAGDYSAGTPIGAVKRSIAFLSFQRAGDFRVCSGFLIADDLLVTNDHCVNDTASCESASVVFDYEKDRNGQITMGEVRRCASLVAGDYDLDYTVLRLDARPYGSFNVLRLAAQDAAVGEPAAMIQHPGGAQKQVVEVGCEINKLEVPGRARDRNDTEFTHRCDTIGGSSGSPIVRTTMENTGGVADCVIGLHHWGFVAGGDYETFNRAVRASVIVKSLKEKGLSPATCG